MVIPITEEHPLEAVGVDVVPVVLVMADVLNLMNVVLMVAIVAEEEEEEEVPKVIKVVEEIRIKDIGKTVFIILDLVIFTWRKNCLALLTIVKQRIRVLISTSMIIFQLKLQVEMYQLLLKRYRRYLNVNGPLY
jgi:hypothetical protein